MNASEPLIYYNLIVGEAFELRGWLRLYFCARFSKSPAIMGGEARLEPAATLTSVSLGGLLLNGQPCQLLTPLGFGPCGSRLQSQ